MLFRTVLLYVPDWVKTTRRIDSRRNDGMTENIIAQFCKFAEPENEAETILVQYPKLYTVARVTSVQNLHIKQGCKKTTVSLKSKTKYWNSFSPMHQEP